MGAQIDRLTIVSIAGACLPLLLGSVVGMVDASGAIDLLCRNRVLLYSRCHCDNVKPVKQGRGKDKGVARPKSTGRKTWRSSGEAGVGGN
jgi:hypothetical protein